MIPRGPPPPLRYLVASGDVLFARRLFERLSRDARASVVGVAATHEEAGRLAKELSPDVVLVDEYLPPPGPVAAVEAIVSASDAGVVVLADRPPKFESASWTAGGILVFAPRDRFVDEEAVVELTALSLTVGAQLRGRHAGGMDPEEDL